MQRYQISKVIGDGTYGSVLLARDNQAGEMVAIKRMKRKYTSWEECIQLREVKSLRKLVHPSIIRLKEVIRENDELHLIFEHMDCNLYQVIKERVIPFPESRVKSMMLQILQALAYMHKSGYFHRDLKPENFLVTRETVKLADFGLAREIRSRPPFTDYVSTRWYRAPEVLLRAANYNSPIDVWACGCIMAELCTLQALFTGNSESDQLVKICTVLGAPTVGQWAEGHRLAAVIGYRFPACTGRALSEVIKTCSSEGVQVIQSLLAWDPTKRVSATAALSSPYFTSVSDLHAPSSDAPVIQKVAEVPRLSVVNPPAEMRPTEPRRSVFSSSAAKSILS